MGKSSKSGGNVSVFMMIFLIVCGWVFVSGVLKFFGGSFGLMKRR